MAPGMTSKVFRFVKLQHARLKALISIIPDLLKRCNGLSNTCLIIAQTFKAEGVSGIRKRIRNIFFHRVHAFPYDEWVRKFDSINDTTRIRFKKAVTKQNRQPLFSVVMPVFNPPVELLEKAINSVQNQLYPNWELCIADDFSSDPDIKALLDSYKAKDDRIKVVYRAENGHISAASNSALELASGEFIALLDHDDELSEHALFWVAEAINNFPDVQMLYSDEDKIDLNGLRYDPYFKCDWNHDLFLSQNMFCHLGIYKSELIHQVGGFKKGLEGSQDYDLTLRCYEMIQPSQIHHIPRILYHWRAMEGSTALSISEKSYAVIAGESAINAYLERNNIPAKAQSTDFGYRVRYQLPSTPPLVSLLIPTRNGVDILRNCIDSILEKTTYNHYEIIIIDNGSDEKESLDYLASIQANNKIKVIRDDSPFNYSALNNKAASYAKGSVLGLINNDVEVITPGWIEEMVSHVSRPDTGAIGARLLYPDDTLQHGGIVLGVGGIAGHSHKHLERSASGYFSRMKLQYACSAVTGACLFVRKKVFEEVGGLNEGDLKVAFNDVDFCLRVIEKGYRNIWTPYCELYHHESKTRGYEDTSEKKERFRKENRYMNQQWGKVLLNDPAYSPNLSLFREDFSIATTPRVRHVI